MHQSLACQPDVAIESSVRVEIEPFQRFGACDGIVAIVEPYYEQVLFVGVQGVGQVGREGKVAPR